MNAAAVERLVRQALEQGHPALVEDPSTLNTVANIVGIRTPGSAQVSQRGRAA